MQKSDELKTYWLLIFLTGLFNLFLFVKLFVIGIFKLPLDLISPWLYAQYFFTYTEEFVKRGAIGTAFHLAGVSPNDMSILFLAILFANFFFILFFFFSRKQMSYLSEKAQILFLLFFIISPAVAMHLGFDVGRFDHITLALTVLGLIFLAQKTSGATYVIVPVLLAIGLLIHEAFLFINAPVLLAASIHEIRKKKYSNWLLIAEVITISAAALCLMIFGKAAPETLQRVSAEVAALTHYDPSSALQVWTNGVMDNVVFGLSRFTKIKILKQIFFALPFLILNVLVYRRFLNPRSLNRSQKFVFYSPLGILPLFVLGVDYIRWIALFVIMMFMAFAYLARESREGFQTPLSMKDKLLLIFIACYSFLGPLGISIKAFPFRELY